MKLKDIDKVEAWKGGGVLPPGWHEVTIESCEEGESSNGNPQLELEYTNDEGSIRDWLVVIEKTYGKVKRLLEAAGVKIEEGDWDLNPKDLEGRRLGIRVQEEPDYKDPTQTRLRVQAYRALSDVPGDTTGLNNGDSKAADAEDDIPF